PVSVDAPRFEGKKREAPPVVSRKGGKPDRRKNAKGRSKTRVRQRVRERVDVTTLHVSSYYSVSCIRAALLPYFRRLIYDLNISHNPSFHQAVPGQGQSGFMSCQAAQHWICRHD